VASAAYLLAAKRHPKAATSASDDTATGYRSQASKPALGGRQ
jgi:AAT family amino acid transporter/GABA permease